MKKIDKLFKALCNLEAEISKHTFEVKDTSVKHGKYFKTVEANTDGLVVFKIVKRTKYLKTYICLNPEHLELRDKYRELEKLYDAEKTRLSNIKAKKWVKQAIERATGYVDKQINEGIIHTNYSKCLIVGNKNIYFAHPHYQHDDYNKFPAMPNTPKNRELAELLNNRLKEAGMQF